MNAEYRSAVRNGVMEAERLHQQLGNRKRIESHGGNIDVFGAIVHLGVPLLLRPLDGLLGAYLREPASGVLVTTQRSLSIQRYTAAHELGHFRLNHEPSLDDEDILRRSPFAANPEYDLQEVEADAFAMGFLMPRWLIAWHAKRQGWKSDRFCDPSIVYQLSLRLGASYEATWRTLQSYKIIERKTATKLSNTKVHTIKKMLLSDYIPSDFRRDVWHLTASDANTSISGSQKDLLILHLKEHCGSGYLWDADELERNGFSVVRDERKEVDHIGVGNPIFRRLTTVLQKPKRGRLILEERRPWQPKQALTQFELTYDLTGPENEGFSWSERRRILEAV